MVHCNKQNVVAFFPFSRDVIGNIIIIMRYFNSTATAYMHYYYFVESEVVVS